MAGNAIWDGVASFGQRASYEKFYGQAYHNLFERSSAEAEDSGNQC